MNTIDARQLPPDVRDLLANAAVTGGAIFQLSDNCSIVVIDRALWEALRQHLPDSNHPEK
jgi:hypothetical protein